MEVGYRDVSLIQMVSYSKDSNSSGTESLLIFIFFSVMFRQVSRYEGGNLNINISCLSVAV